MNIKKLITHLFENKFSEKITSNYEKSEKDLNFDILPEVLLDCVSIIHSYPKINFPLLIDIFGIDYSEYSIKTDHRFAVIYIFYSIKEKIRIKLRVLVPEDKLEVYSIYSYYKGAIFSEREVYDMYGIVFLGHPNLKRLLMPENFGSYPLRKDYPLKGKGERSQFPKYNIYNKVNDLV